MRNFNTKESKDWCIALSSMTRAALTVQKQLLSANGRIQLLENEKTHLAQSLVSLEGTLRNKTQLLTSTQKEVSIYDVSG